MKSNNHWGRFAAVAAMLLVLSTGAAMAQLQSGNLYGKVADQTGAILPGVTVTLDTGSAPQVQVTNAQGEFRFLSLSPGNYKIKAELQGFSTVEYPNISINIGRNTSIEVTLNSAVEETITVTSESPLLDEKAIRTGNTVSQNELQKIPTARDPWTVLSATPGVLVDRVNVGGNESGQQSSYVGPGSFSTQSVWAVDGVVITDMAATGSSPAYYDFDSFEEMQISTGGSDSTIATGGVVLNMVTKRGTNEYRGSARYYQAPGATQANTSAKNLPAGDIGDQIKKVEDYGAEVGGPIVKDHLWAWGSYAKQTVQLLTLNGLTDTTDLPAWNAKLNAQVTASNSLTLFGLDSNKQKQGRNAGPSRSQETTWDQGVFGGQPTLLKAEDTQIFSPNLYLTVLYSHVYGGFQLVPESGIGAGVPSAFFDSSGVAHNSFLFEQIKRPQNQEKADASTFFNTGSLSHELKYGFSYRQAESVTSLGWPGGGNIFAGDLVGFPADENLAQVIRNEVAGVNLKYKSGYLQDTITTGNLTANVGLRYDVQGGDNLSETVPANSIDPAQLPAVAFAGGPIGMQWETWSPRIGLTYALGKDHGTLLRASYSRFADQMGSAVATFLNPLGATSYYYVAVPSSTTVLTGPGQFIPGTSLGFSGNVNPANGQLLEPNLVSKNLNAPTTDEFLLSAEHALLPEFVVGLNLTYRLQMGLLQEDSLVASNSDPNNFTVATRNDYVQNFGTATLPNGQQTTYSWFSLAPGLFTNKGFFLHNGDYETTYKGASLTFNKRLSNRWMMRGNFTYSDWYYSKAGDRPDPTILLAGGTTDGNYVNQGDVVLQGSGTASGSKAFVFINSKWSMAVNGMYQIAPDRPWGFNVAGNFTGRQGYPDPFYITVQSPGGNATPDNVQVGSADSNRLDNIFDFDARIEKEFTFQDFGMTLGVDCFNLLNEAYVLQARDQLQAGTSNAGQVTEILSPRIFRFGVRDRKSVV